MTFAVYKTAVVLIGGVLALRPTIAQPLNVDGVEVRKVTYYELISDGHPILGFITTKLSGKRVQFTTCRNITREVDSRQLTKSSAKCFERKGSGDGGTWIATATSNSVQPLIKTDSTLKTMVYFQGKNLDFGRLPASFSGYVSSAKVGDVVGVAFTTDDGKKVFGVLTEGE